MLARKCENCDFWMETDTKGGMCRRYPPRATPQAIQKGGNVLVGQRPGPVSFLDIISWPKTKKDDWCGEFANE